MISQAFSRPIYTFLINEFAMNLLFSNKFVPKQTGWKDQQRNCQNWKGYSKREPEER
jgi:hypothetical protein